MGQRDEERKQEAEEGIALGNEEEEASESELASELNQLMVHTVGANVRCVSVAETG